jgi:hypothetical protein
VGHKGNHRCGLCNACFHESFAKGLLSQKVRNSFVNKSFHEIEFPQNEKQAVKDSVIKVEHGAIPLHSEQASKAWDILKKDYKRSKILKGKKFSCTGHLGSPFKTNEVKDFLIKNGATFLEGKKKHEANFIITSFTGAKKHLEDEKSVLKNSFCFHSFSFCFFLGKGLFS